MKINQHRTQKGRAKIEITLVFTKKNNFKSSRIMSHFLRNEFLVLVVLFELSEFFYLSKYGFGVSFLFDSSTWKWVSKIYASELFCGNTRNRNLLFAYENFGFS